MYVMCLPFPSGSVNISNLAIQCDTGLDWSVFVQAATQALMSPNQDVLLK